MLYAVSRINRDVCRHSRRLQQGDDSRGGPLQKGVPFLDDDAGRTAFLVDIFLRDLERIVLREEVDARASDGCRRRVGQFGDRAGEARDAHRLQLHRVRDAEDLREPRHEVLWFA